MFIVSAAADLPDKQATTERLLRNQQDIGDAIKPFYGRAAGERLSALLTEHILVAADVLAAAKAATRSRSSDTAGLVPQRQPDRRLPHKANPRDWPRGEMRAMMREHLDLTLAEAVALTRDHRADIRAYDRIHRQILGMADMLSDGIVAQFPKRF